MSSDETMTTEAPAAGATALASPEPFLTGRQLAPMIGLSGPSGHAKARSLTKRKNDPLPCHVLSGDERKTVVYLYSEVYAWLKRQGTGD